MIDIIFISFRFYSLKLCIIQNKNKNIWQSAVINECSFSNLHWMKGNILSWIQNYAENIMNAWNYLTASEVEIFFNIGWKLPFLLGTHMLCCRSCGNENSQEGIQIFLILHRQKGITTSGIYHLTSWWCWSSHQFLCTAPKNSIAFSPTTSIESAFSSLTDDSDIAGLCDAPKIVLSKWR